MKRALLITESSIYTVNGKIIARGGGEVFFHKLARSLKEIGIEPTVLAISEYGKQQKEEEIEGIKYLRTPVKSRTSLMLFKYLKLAIKESKNYDYTFFNQFSPHLILPFVKNKKIAVVHDIYFQYLFWIKQYGLIKGSFGYLIERAQLKFDKKFADQIITVSESSASKIIDILGEKIKTKISLAPYQINFNDYLKSKKRKFLLYVGRFVNYKNPQHVLYALKEVQTLFPEFKAVFVTPRLEKNTFTNFEKIRKKLSIDKKDVIIKTDCDNQELKKLLSQAHVLMQPSNVEGQGIITLEALASQTPVIAYNLPAYKDTLINGKNAILVETNNLSDYSRATKELLNNYEEFRKNCHKNLKENQDFSSTIEKICYAKS